ncbi:MAG: DEAD/DEAH box helicase [Polyangiales bacterium]
MTTSRNDFASLGLGEQLRRALRDVGYTEPTPIQSQAIPELLQGRDLLGIAQTGTGKTAAFALPLLQRLAEERKNARPKRPRALILAPTRELALQIHDEIERFGKYTKLRQASIFGGVSANPQIKALSQGLDVVVATPGRLLDLASQRKIDLSEVSVLVLDEADRLLDMGFIRDVKRIVAMTPRSRQSLLFSATMPKAVASLAQEILDQPVRVDVSPKRVTVDEIDQRIVMVGTSDKQRMLEHLLRDDEVSRAIVFTRTKHGANKVARKLGNAGINAEAIHGNKSQNARQRALRNFKSGDAWVLVATDIAARGIDVEAVSHVFNYELPHEPESYVHRIGRTGRAGATGAAWSLVDPSERGRLRAVERLIRFSPTHVDVDMPHQEPVERARADEATQVNRPRRRNRRPASSNQRANAAAHPRAGSRRR